MSMIIALGMEVDLNGRTPFGVEELFSMEKILLIQSQEHSVLRVVSEVRWGWFSPGPSLHPTWNFNPSTTY